MGTCSNIILCYWRVELHCSKWYLALSEYFSLQWNRGKGTHCSSSIFILMQQQIRAAYMEAVQWLRERNGQQQDGFMLGHSTNRLIGKLGVWTRTRTAQNGQMQGSARRIQRIWSAQKQTMDIAERAAKLAHLKKQVKSKLWLEVQNFCIAKTGFCHLG